MKAKVKKVLNCGCVRWVADLRCFNSGRKFFETEDEAITHWEAKAREVRQLGVEALNLSHEDRVQFMLAQEKLKPVGARIIEAVEFFLKFQTALQKRTMREAYDEFVTSKTASGKRPRYIKALGYSIGRFVDAVETRECSTVTRQEIESWMFRAGLSPVTVRGYQIDFQTFFNFCLKRGYVSKSPCEGIEKVTIDQKPPAILTPEQCERLLNTARVFKNGRYLPAIVLGLFAGVRSQEINRLNWENVQVERGFVEIPALKAKTRERRIVQLSENAKAWLKLGGQLPPVRQKNWITYVRREAGILSWDGNEMRHSFASYHLAKHGSADLTATQMGHRSTDMLFKHYRELVTKEEAERFWSIRPNP